MTSKQMPAWHPEDTGPTGKPDVWKCYGPNCGALVAGPGRAAHDEEFHDADKAVAYDRIVACEVHDLPGGCDVECLRLLDQMDGYGYDPLTDGYDPTGCRAPQERPEQYRVLLDGTVWLYYPTKAEATR